MSEPAIDLQAVYKSFRRTEVLRGVTLRVERGKTFAFIGRNASGKTTTIRMLLGLLKRDDGAIRVLGLDPAREPLELRRRVGYLAEDQTMYGWMQVGEILRFVAPFYSTWDHDLALKYVRDFELPIATKIKHLSKGQNVRLGLVLALAHRPELVILDDPALGLDPIMRKQFNRDLITHLQGEGRTVFYSSHLLYEVEPVADEVAILDQGRIVRQADTETLRRDVKQVILSREAFDAVRGQLCVLDERSDGERMVVAVERAESAIERLGREGVEHRVVNLNLDEIFEAYVVGRRDGDDGTSRTMKYLQPRANGSPAHHQTFQTTMRTVWHSLAWKEWHEHKWKLASVTAILTAVSAAVLIDDESSLFDGEALLVMLIYGMAPLALFLGASEAAGERTRGTLHFTQSLPVPMRKVAAWKLTFGLTTCILPILITLALLAVWYLIRSPFNEELARSLRFADREFPRPAWLNHDLVVWLLGAGVIGCTVAASLFLWTVAVGVNRKSEVRAGATTLLVFVIWWIAFAVSAEIVSRRWPDSTTNWLAVGATSVSPGMFPASLAFALFASEAQIGLMILAVAAASVVYTLLAAWFIGRFGSQETNDVGSRAAVAARDGQRDWLPPPRRSPFTAILWKQFRESGPIVAVGLVAILGFFLGKLAADQGYYDNDASYTVDLLVTITAMIGLLVALIVGIGMFDQDLGPRLNDFWRSRPIHPDLWFWTKYLAGLSILGLGLYSPVLIAFWWSLQGEHVRDSMFGAAIMLGFHMAFYATATATIVLIRQPVYAAILGIGAALVGVAIVESIWGREAINLEWMIYGSGFGTAGLATLLAWLAVRYNWGRKN